MTRFAVALVIVLASVVDSGAKCARTDQQPKVLTTRDTKLPDDGGILVGWQNVVYNDAADHPKGDPSDQPWTATDGVTKLALTRVSLAPGLSVYRAGGKAAVVLASKTGKTLGTFSHDAKTAANAMAAPAVTELALSVDSNGRWSERRAIAKLTSAPPPAAAALVVYAIGAKANTAISFVTLPDTHDTLMKLDVFQDAGHCGSVVDGSRPPTKGEKLAFAWVDTFGRLSAVSSTITAK